MPRRIILRIRGFLLLSCLYLTAVHASSANQAHPHQGVVQPFLAGDPKVKLNKAAEKLLSQGKPFQTQIQSGAADGTGLVVQDVEAPTDVVWGRILDFNSYNKMVPKTMESQIYKRKPEGRGAERIWVRMKVGFTPAPRLTFYVNHLYQPRLHSMTWRLDYTRKSDFNDSCGYWYVIPHPKNKHWTRVYYSVNVSMFSWVPKFVVDFMSKQALVDATGWVKKYSELEYAKKKPKQSSSGDSAAASNLARRGLFARLFRKKTGNDSSAEESHDTSPRSAKPSPASLRRYALASTAVALVGCNIYLFVSR